MTRKWTGAHIQAQRVKLTLAIWNGLLVEGWAAFVDDQNEQLKSSGTSSIMKGWEAVGLITGIVSDSSFWRHAIETLGAAPEMAQSAAAAGTTAAAAAASSAAPGETAWLLKVNRDRSTVENAPLGSAFDLRWCGNAPGGLPAAKTAAVTTATASSSGAQAQGGALATGVVGAATPATTTTMDTADTGEITSSGAATATTTTTTTTTNDTGRLASFLAPAAAAAAAGF